MPLHVQGAAEALVEAIAQLRCYETEGNLTRASRCSRRRRPFPLALLGLLLRAAECTVGMAWMDESGLRKAAGCERQVTCHEKSGVRTLPWKLGTAAYFLGGNRLSVPNFHGRFVSPALEPLERDQRLGSAGAGIRIPRVD